MSRRAKLTAALTLLALAIGLGVRFFMPAVRPPPDSSESDELVASKRTNVPFGSSPPSGAAASPRPLLPNSVAKLKRAVENKNVPIDFWGKVVDQEGTPLPGVKVTATSRRWQTVGIAFGSSFASNTAVTDQGGLFRIKGGMGDVLTIKAIEKEGYEAEPMALRSYGYNISTNVVVSADAPILFRLWQKGSRQSLVTGLKFFSVIPDGRTYTIDLLKTTLIASDSAEGDLRIKVTRPMAAKFGDRYDWSLEIEALDGGLVEEPDRYADMFLAPAEGYTNLYRLSRAKSEQRWSGFTAKSFYTKTRTNMYSRVKFKIHACFGTAENIGAFDLNFASNPSGSRVLRGSP